jgi:NarL family two-component system response regulator LiaR
MMPKMDGPTATQQIRAECPPTQVIALTSFAEPDLVQQAIQSGAIGYVLKDTHADHLAEAIRNAYRGQASIDPAAAQALVQATQDTTRLGYDLTDREREILAMLVEGQTNKQIAEALTISLGTVRFHVSNILSKLGASNRTEAARLALEAGLLE